MTPAQSDRFDSLVRTHQAGLRAYIRSLGTLDVWVDDLAQEAFLVAYRRHRHFAAGADFGCWLRGIARNLVLNERRKSARRSRLLQESIVDVLCNESEPLPSAVPTVEPVLHAMAECVAQLPSRSRELLQRRYAECNDAPALARTFCLSAAAVRQTLVRSRLAVRRCIEGKLGEAWL